MAGFLSRLGSRLAVISIGLGLGCMYAGWDNFNIASKTKAEPTEITAAQLSKSGPPSDNAYVRVTDFNLNYEYILVRKKTSSDTKDSKDSKDDSSTDDASRWDRVWLQVVPVDQSDLGAGKTMILKDDEIHGKQDLEEFGKKTSFDAIVMNGLDHLSPPKTPSGMHFPDIDEDKDIMLDIRSRPDSGSAIGWGLTGLGLALLGGLGLFRRFAMGRGGSGGTITSSTMGGNKKW